MWGASRFAGWPIFWRRTGWCFWGADFLRQMERDVQPSLTGLWCARPAHPPLKWRATFLAFLTRLGNILKYPVLPSWALLFRLFRAGSNGGIGSAPQA